MSIDEFNLEKYKKINFSSGHLFYLEKFSKNLNTRILLKDDGNYGLGLARGTKVRRFEYFFWLD
jgi:hypothetical protein